MAQVSYPGVYIQEVPSGVHTIAGVATSITAFVGFFKEGDMDKATQIFGMSDFNRIFGGLDDRSEASYAISQFFKNGGTEAQVIRVAAGSPEKAVVEIRKLASAASKKIMKVEAKNEGVWGNTLRARIDHDTSDSAKYFNFYITRYESEDNRAAPIITEKFLNLSTDDEDSRYFVNVINNDSELVRVTRDAAANDDELPASNGTYGDAINPTAAQILGFKDKTFKIQIGTQGPFTATLTWSGDNPTNLLQLRGHLEKAIQSADTANNSPSFTGARVQLIDSRFLISSGQNSPHYAPSEIIAITQDGASTLHTSLGLTGASTQNVQEYTLGANAAANIGAQVSGGTEGADGDKPGANELKGDPNLKTGVYALKEVDLFNILCIPQAADLNATQMSAVYSTALDYCKERRAFLIIDIPEAINTFNEMKDWMDANNGLRDKNSAVYFPRPQIPDPKNDYRLRAVGASGTMAGLYSRIDSSRGVWKAPAGTEATLQGVSQLAANLTDQENGTLNPLAINCLRTFPVYGHTAWGARTLDGSDVKGSEWKYIPIRRLALFLEESLFRGTKWVVFEPNDEPLWAKIRLNITAFMMGLFRQGAFQGSSPDQAFYVKCDSETTTQADRNLGIVNIEVGFAPLKPAEFVVIKFQQIAGELV